MRAAWFDKFIWVNAHTRLVAMLPQLSTGWSVLIRQFPGKGTGLNITETASSLGDWEPLVLPLVVLREVNLNSIPVKDVSFDDTATLAMGEAFDHACVSLHRVGTLITARELIAKRIIEAAKNGERDPARLHEQSLIPFGIEDMSMLVVSVGRDPPVPTYASVTRPAWSKARFSPEPGFLLYFAAEVAALSF
jgi:hypothetical protein